MQTLSILERAKLKLVISEPFFGQLLMYIKFIESKTIVDTIGVNAEGEIYYNPDFLAGKSDEQILVYLQHEILHLAYMHPIRGQNLDKLVYNLAADLKVNYCLLFEYGVPERFLKDAVCPKYNGWEFKGIKIPLATIKESTSEELYRLLMKEIEEKKLTLNKDDISLILDVISGKLVEGRDGLSIKPFSSSRLKELEEEMKQRIEICKMQGILPGQFLRDYTIENEHKINWFVYLIERFLGISRKKTWRKFSKKLLPNYLPGKEKEKYVNIAVAVDTSGSISKNELSKFMTEVWHLALIFPDFKMKFITCDAEVFDVVEINQENFGRLKKMIIKGQGGTDFRPVFDYIKKHKIKVDYLIYFTDLYGEFPKEKPDFEVFWVTNSRQKEPPFGKVLYF